MSCHCIVVGGFCFSEKAGLLLNLELSRSSEQGLPGDAFDQLPYLCDKQ